MIDSVTSYDYNRVCYPHNDEGRGIAKSLSKQPTDICHTNTVSTCDTRDDLDSAASAKISQNSIDVMSDIKITCTRSTSSSDAYMKMNQNCRQQSAVPSSKYTDFYREPSWDTATTKQQAMKASQDSMKQCTDTSSKCNDLYQKPSCDTVTKQRSNTASFDSVLDQAITALDTTFKRDNTTSTTADKKSPTITPASFETADHVALLKLSKDSSLSHRAAAAMEMLKVNSYFTKQNIATSTGSAKESFGSTSNNVISSESLAWQLSPFDDELLPSKSQESISPMSADIVTSESLAWQISFKSHENTSKNEVSSVKDIDIVVTDSHDDGNSVESKVGKISSLLNDFSFTLKQMINITCSDESVNSVHSFEDSLVSLEDGDDHERKKSNVASANFGMDGEVEGCSKSIGERFVMKSDGAPTKRKCSRDSLSTTSDYSSDSNNDASGHNSTAKRFIMKNDVAATKRKNTRDSFSTASDYSSDSNNDSSEQNSALEQRFIMRADAKWNRTRDSLSVASKDSIDNNSEASSRSFTASGKCVAKKSNRCDSLSSNFSVPPELEDDFDNDGKKLYASDDLESCSMVSSNSSNISREEDSDTDESFDMEDSDENFTKNTNRSSLSKETLGLEMIANPALLFKYN
eukprot:scaffold41515_cov74-Cyclotella_meneghiniana.AAC.3